MNPSLALLAQYLRKTPQEVETAWRDAKQFRKTEGGKDYRIAWEHLGKLLKVPPLKRLNLAKSAQGGQKVWDNLILGSGVYIGEVGATTMVVETLQGDTFVIPSCFLLVDGKSTTHDTVI